MEKYKGFFQSIFGTIRKILKNVTIEPVVFFLYCSFAIDTITLDQLKITKSCLTDFKYPQEVCDNLVDGNHTEENNLVQNEVGHLIYKLKSIYKFISDLGCPVQCV